MALLLLLLLLLLLVGPQLADPVAAHNDPGCGNTDISPAELALASTRTQQLAKSVSAQRLADATPTPIEVYFHSVYAGNVGKVKTAQLDATIDVLNRCYSGAFANGGSTSNGNTNYNTQFTFKGVRFSRVDYAPWLYVQRNDSVTQESSVTGQTKLFFRNSFKTDSEKSSSALHIYLADLINLNGFAWFPWATKNMTYLNLDGVYVDYTQLPGPGSRAIGSTFCHEVGHWLGLFHTFQDQFNENACSISGGDQVFDTVPESKESSEVPGVRTSCPRGRRSCATRVGATPAQTAEYAAFSQQLTETYGEGYEDDITNYMSYSSDSCRTGFTKGQSDRMQLWAVERGIIPRGQVRAAQQTRRSLQGRAQANGNVSSDGMEQLLLPVAAEALRADTIAAGAINTSGHNARSLLAGRCPGLGAGCAACKRVRGRLTCISVTNSRMYALSAGRVVPQAGYYYQYGKSVATPCRAGYYKPKRGRSACLRCYGTVFAAATGCVPRATVRKPLPQSQPPLPPPPKPVNLQTASPPLSPVVGLPAAPTRGAPAGAPTQQLPSTPEATTQPPAPSLPVVAQSPPPPPHRPPPPPHRPPPPHPPPPHNSPPAIPASGEETMWMGVPIEELTPPVPSPRSG